MNERQLTVQCLAIIAATLITVLVGCEESSSNGHGFHYYEEFAAEIRKATDVAVFEGLPHDRWEADLLDSELKSKETIQIDGYPFYEKPVEFTANDQERITSLYCNKKLFTPFSGPKGCGGYHPDWLVKWKKGETEWIVHFCFGCSEATTISGDKRMLCDIRESEPLEKLLSSYRRQRPDNNWESSGFR